jgi:phage terminase large subunit-like protein
MGISTLVAGYALYCMLFKESYKVLVIAVTQDVAKNIVSKVKVMHENLPVFLRGKIVDDNKLELSFTNGSSIKAVSSSPTAARSHGLSLLIIDECLEGSAEIEIKHKDTGEIRKVSLKELYESREYK